MERGAPAGAPAPGRARALLRCERSPSLFRTGCRGQFRGLRFWGHGLGPVSFAGVGRAGRRLAESLGRRGRRIRISAIEVEPRNVYQER